MSDRAKADFKRKVAELIMEMKRHEALTRPSDFEGDEAGGILEHNVRKYFFNELLPGLGWNLAQAVAEEARVKAEQTLFLDYLGVHLDLRKPALIFEAKAWEKPFVSAVASENAEKSPSQLIAETLDHIKLRQPAARATTAQWTEWIGTLRDYAIRLHAQSGTFVPRVAISSGQGLVIFTDTKNAFLDAVTVNPDSILTFRIQNFVEQSDQIFDHLSYQTIVGAPPELLRPTELPTYLNAQAIRHVFRSLWVARHSTGSRVAFPAVPRLEVFPVAIVQRSDGVLLTVRDDTRAPIWVPNGSDALSQHLVEVDAASDALLRDIGQVLRSPVIAASIEEFPGFPSIPVRGSVIGLALGSDLAGIRYARSIAKAPDEFIVVTGSLPHFLLAAPRVAGCIGHEWGQCEQERTQFGPAPILHQSVSPRAYYANGSPHHCAHRGIHDRRHNQCHIALFDDYLCCQACAYQPLCWEDEPEASPPCGTMLRAVAPVVAEAE